MSLIATLNPRQREAVLHGDGPLLVIAGAGSGKTRVVVTRIAHLVRERGVAPASILAVTFTNKAADEMRERVLSLLEDDGAPPRRIPLVSTFHSFCVRLLRMHGAPLARIREGFTTSFQIFDRQDQLAVVKQVNRQLGLNEREIKPAAAISAISRAKNAGRRRISHPRSTDPDDEALDRVFELYEATLLDSNALDFDDLLLMGVELLRHSADVRDLVRGRYRYLLIDEYQDTNRPQYDLMRLLAEPRRNVCVVGDEDQAIYSWRGADIGNILGFESDFPTAKVVRLEQNYRSTKSILAAAGAVIGHNKRRKGKRLWSDGPSGDRPLLHRARDAHAEARFVARAAGASLEREPEERFAVLYRTNAQSRLIEEALRSEGIDYVVVCGVAFYQRAEVKDHIAYLKAALSPEDAVSLRRIINVPARGIGKSTLQRLEHYASSKRVSLWSAINDSLDRRLISTRVQSELAKFRDLMLRLRGKLGTSDLGSLIAWISKESGYRDMLESSKSPDAESRIENIQELKVAASEVSAGGASLQEFLDRVALVSDSDGIDGEASVQLMTLHTAKGLEFDTVAVVGVEERLLPHSRSMLSAEPLEEERRLFYVGMTRARRFLLITSAEMRSLYGNSMPQPAPPSRFLSEIPGELVREHSAPTRGGFRTGRAFASSPGRGAAPARTAPPAGPKRSNKGGIVTYDTVAAVEQFFKGRGKSKKPSAPASATPARPASPDSVPARSPVRRRVTKPGRGTMNLRARGQFPRGTRVRHQKFGLGVVQRREGEGQGAKLSVYFERYGMKKLVAGYANLREL